MNSNGKKRGALSPSIMREMVGSGYLSADYEKRINQASIDLSITGEVYRLESAFLPRPGESIQSILANIRHWPHPTGQPLMRGQTYLAKIDGNIKLPNSIYGYANPKSSLGRTDTHIRLVADGVARYDCLPRNFTGDCWVLIHPKSFHIIVGEGLPLNQARFFNEDTRLEQWEVEDFFYPREKLLWDCVEKKPIPYEDIRISDSDGSLILLIDLETSERIGFKALRSEIPLDLTGKDADPKIFFEEIMRPSCGTLGLEQGEFYILSTLEALRVPTMLACEMVPMDERAGEFRSHYAGYIDPGWGYGNAGEGIGRQITLEIRTFEKIVLRARQPIAKIRFERMTEVAPTYDNPATSHYTHQSGPTLGKYFAKW